MTDYKKALIKKIALVEMKLKVMATARDRDLLEAELKMLQNDLNMCGGMVAEVKGLYKNDY